MTHENQELPFALDDLSNNPKYLRFLEDTSVNYISQLDMLSDKEAMEDLRLFSEIVADLCGRAWQTAYEIATENIFQREKLLHPELCVSAAYYAEGIGIPGSELQSASYYMQPVLKTDKCEEAYANFQDWVAQYPRGPFAYVDCLKGIPGLAIEFRFFEKTEQVYAQDDEEWVKESYSAIDIDDTIAIYRPEFTFAVDNISAEDFIAYCLDGIETYHEDMGIPFAEIAEEIFLLRDKAIERIALLEQIKQSTHYSPYPDLDFID